MSRRIALVAVMALAAAVFAVIGATAALSLLGNGVLGPGGKPLTQADVRRALAQPVAAGSPSPASPAPATPRHPTATPGPAPVTGVFGSSGGTVNASCLSGQVTLTSWIPAQGYQSDGASPGPATSAWVKFKAGGTELTVTATCTGGGRPRFVSSADNRGGGGGDGGGGGGSGGGSGGSGSGGGSSGH
jgi:uncharacterized membrane protein YgcG